MKICGNDTFNEPERSLVSVIVPVYNTQSYLEQCLNSLAVQSYSNLEIIMVNDGSTDDSSVICRKFSEIDSRFFLIEQENAGLSAARNTGLKYAKGNYICFVDSDDCVHSDYVKMLYDNLKKYHVNVSMCGYVKFQDGTDPDIFDNELIESNQVNVEVLDRLDMLRDLSTFGPQNKSERIVIACNKLICRSYLKDFYFVENKIHEDEFMINEILQRIDKATFSNAKLYFYRQRKVSITGVDNKKNLSHLDALDAYEQRLHLFCTAEYKNIYGNLVASYLSNCIYLYLTLICEENVRFLKRKIYPRYIRCYFRNLRHLSMRKIIEYSIFLISPDLYRKICWE